MKRTNVMGTWGLCLVVGLIAVVSGKAGEVNSPPALPPSPDVLDKTPTWKQPAAAEVQSRLMKWLEKTNPTPAVRANAAALWTRLPQQPSGGELLDCLVQSVALADANAAKLMELCSRPRSSLSSLELPSQAWLQDSKLPPLVTANCRLFYGRWLVQGAWFDEALDQLSPLGPADVVAPAELLFYQGVVYHRLLQQEQAAKAIDELLDGADTSPRRYVEIARLMQADLETLKPDTLDHIARRMGDIQRRLELGRAGPKVRKVEDGVIESLDKLIKKLEDAQQQASSSSSSNGGNRPTQPLPNSRPVTGKGPGRVTKRNIGNRSGWGDLPPKEREEAMQQIGRDFPPHYRDVIEQYFRRLATEDNEKNDRKK